MRLLAFLLLSLVPLAHAHAQSSTDTLSLVEAQSLSPQVLARRVLGMSGVLVREAVVEGYNSRYADPRRLAQITFASPPRAGEYAGLCAADVYTVAFASPGDGEKLFDSPGPVRIAGLRSQTVYRIVDAGPVPADGWSVVYGNKLMATCAKLTSVIQSSPYVRLSFFSVNDEGAASFIGRLLGEVASKENPAICHARRPEMCQDRAKAFQAFSFTSANIQPCKKNVDHWCVMLNSQWGLDSTVLKIEIAAPGNFSKPPIIYAVELQDIRGVE